MSNNEKVELVLMDKSHEASLLGYALPPDQMPFTALPQQVFERIALRNAAGDLAASVVCVLFDDRAVGMFVLDRGADLGLWTDNTQAFLLRSFSIDPHYQRRGIATQAMQLLPAFIKKEFDPLHINEIVLGVNIKNDIAQKLYSGIGFVEKGFNMNPPFVGQMIMKWKFG